MPDPTPRPRFEHLGKQVTHRLGKAGQFEGSCRPLDLPIVEAAGVVVRHACAVA
jgi:hypothetical protein